MTETPNNPPFPWFYCATLAAGGDITLTGDEAHHVTVQRLRRGDAIALFDGTGNLVYGTIDAIDRRDVQVRVQQRLQQARATPALALYCAVPKGDRVSVLLDMATQLGMTSFTPVTWARSVVEPRANAVERWHRVCLEACKQSRRPHLPELSPPIDIAHAGEHAKASGALLLVAHPSASARPLSAISLKGNNRLALFVGPEGGITEAEVQRLQALGAQPVDLGTGILRIETAAVALLALAATLGNSD